MRSWLSTVLAGMLLLALASAPASGQRKPPPPGLARPGGPPLDAFIASYDDAGRPLLAIVEVLSAPGGDAPVAQDSYVELLSQEVRRNFADKRIRMAASGVSSAYRVNPEMSRLAARAPAAAATQIAREIGAEEVFLLVLRPTFTRTTNATEFDGSYELVDVRRNRSQTGRLFNVLSPGTDTVLQQRGALLERDARAIAREMMKTYIAWHEEPFDAAPGRRPAAVPADPARPARVITAEIDVEVVGEFEDWEMPAIVKEIRRLPSVDRLLDGPSVDFIDDDGPRSVRMTLSTLQMGNGTGGSFDLANELSGALFMATGKDSRIVRARATDFLLEMKSPVSSTWIGRTSPRNVAARRALTQAYASKDRPRIAVMVTDVSAVDEREGQTLTWQWYFEFLPDFQETGDPLAHGASGVSRAVARHLLKLGLDVVDPKFVFDAFGDEDESDLRNIRWLTDGMRAKGVEILAAGSGQMNQLGDDASISYHFSVNNVANGRMLAATAASTASSTTRLRAGKFTDRVAAEQAAQIVDQLMDDFSNHPDTMSLVVTNARTSGEASAIRQLLEGVPGVLYLTTRRIGESGAVVEVAHRGAGRAIRTALEDGDGLGFELALHGDSTASRFSVRIVREDEPLPEPQAEPADAPAERETGRGPAAPETSLPAVLREPEPAATPRTPIEDEPWPPAGSDPVERAPSEIVPASAPGVEPAGEPDDWPW